MLYYSRQISREPQKINFYWDRFHKEIRHISRGQFNKFVSMYYKISEKKKLITIGTPFEIDFLLNHFEGIKRYDLVFYFIQELYFYSHTNNLSKRTKIKCNHILKKNKKKEIFIFKD